MWKFLMSLIDGLMPVEFDPAGIKIQGNDVLRRWKCKGKSSRQLGTLIYNEDFGMIPTFPEDRKSTFQGGQHPCHLIL